MDKSINVISIAASPLKGEMTLGANILNDSLFGYLKDKGINLYKNIKNVFKDKRKRSLTIIISIIWLVLMIIRSLNINFFLIDIISYFTLSNSGLSGGIIPFIGGLIGKSVYVYFLSSLILQSKGDFRIVDHIKQFLKTFNLKDKSFFIFSSVGIGLSLIMYNFMTGNGSIDNSFIGIVSILLLLKTLYSKTGMMRETLHLLLNKVKIMKGAESNNLNSVVAGCIVGFMLGIAISPIGKNLSYIVGFSILIINIVVSIIIKNIKPLKIN